MSRILNSTIVRQLKSGDRRGCEALVAKYRHPLLGQAINVFSIESADAEELVNDVLLTVVEKIHSFEFRKGESDFHGWVLTIFRNRIRDAVRREAARGVLIERFTEQFGDEEGISSTDRDVIHAVVTAYQHHVADDRNDGSPPFAIVAEALERLESWERVLLRCRALQVPYEDIARYTGKSVPYLKVYHGRIKKKFVKILQSLHPDFIKHEERQH